VQNALDYKEDELRRIDVRSTRSLTLS